MWPRWGFLQNSVDLILGPDMHLNYFFSLIAILVYVFIVTDLSPSWKDKHIFILPDLMVLIFSLEL